MNNAIPALRALLSYLPYHSTLWNLYYVCKDLRSYKPDFSNLNCNIEATVIGCRSHCFRFYVSGTPSDGFFVDGRICHVVFGKHLYEIPIEWIKRLYCTSPRTWYLNHVKFCCRLNVVQKGEKRILLEQDLCLKGIDVHREMYHVGIGQCYVAPFTFYTVISLCIGWGKINKYVENEFKNTLYEENCFRLKVLRAIEKLQIYEVEETLLHFIFCDKCCCKLNDYLDFIVRRQELRDVCANFKASQENCKLLSRTVKNNFPITKFDFVTEEECETACDTLTKKNVIEEFNEIVKKFKVFLKNKIVVVFDYKRIFFAKTC